MDAGRSAGVCQRPADWAKCVRLFVRMPLAAAGSVGHAMTHATVNITAGDRLTCTPQTDRQSRRPSFLLNLPLQPCIIAHTDMHVPCTSGMIERQTAAQLMKKTADNSGVQTDYARRQRPTKITVHSCLLYALPTKLAALSKAAVRSSSSAFTLATCCRTCVRV